MGSIQQKVLKGGTLKGSLVARVYSTGPVEVKGTIACTNSPFVLNYDLTLQRGWNAVEYTKVGDTNTLVKLDPQAATELIALPEPGYLGMMLSPEHIQLSPDGTATVLATIRQHGGYHGPVSLRTSRADLTVTPATLTLPALTSLRAPAGVPIATAMGLQPQQVVTRLTFKYMGPGAQNLPFFLNATDVRGEFIGGGRGTLTSVQPAVNLSLEQTHLAHMGVYVCQGETLNLKVQVTGLNGFTGETTVGLTGLPAGVTAPAVPVTVVAGRAATASLDLTVESGAALVASRIQLISPDLAATDTDLQLPFSTCPARTPIRVISTSGMTPALVVGGDGVWIHVGHSAQPNPLTNVHDQIYKWHTPAGEGITVLGPDMYRAIPMPGGDVIFGGGNADGTRYRLTLAGQYTTLRPPYSFAGTGAADDKGRIWYAARSGELRRWDPISGQDIVMDTNQTYNREYDWFYASPDHKTILYKRSSASASGVYFYTIHTDTGTITPRPLSGHQILSEKAAISDTGTIWFEGFGGGVARVDQDATVTTYENQRFLALNQSETNGAWMSDGKTVTLRDEAGQVVQSIPVGSVFDAAPLKSGGVALLTADHMEKRQYYISFLR
ncbi:hypothetical protein GO986_06695 [Deinococcus sp. HMF7620]|uniref:Uncharacterized protein n=1 Tax=Deinococcus arboris TaxID=2682977 RepID=A0A7C9HXH3_9DEIO|nr:hypothetical protein [Deinococcus arboris]MVN86450.1 hypothetical protein [Deinococcus arboris]